MTDTVRPDGHKVGMITFFISEVAFFSTLITTYVIYLGQDTIGPTPAEVLSLNLVIINTICLLSSSVTVHLAEMALRKGNSFLFSILWLMTILLGAAFIAGTGYEWYNLMTDPERPLTIGRNLFGSTFYTLVGFHGAHVTVGLILLTLILVLFWNGQVTAKSVGLELVGWYWHFVDGVWIVVFVIVYLLGR